MSGKRKMCYRNKCCLCGYDKDSTDIITHFIFPKKEDIRKAWASFCNLTLTEIDDVKTKLCSRHFKIDDLVKHETYFLLKNKSCIPEVRTHITSPSNTLGDHSIKRRKKHCYLCGLDGSDQIVAYFRFPKKAEQRRQWAEFCGMNSASEVSDSYVLCNRHFLQCDVRDERNRGGRVTLSPNAVPVRIMNIEDVLEVEAHSGVIYMDDHEISEPTKELTVDECMHNSENYVENSVPNMRDHFENENNIECTNHSENYDEKSVLNLENNFENSGSVMHNEKDLNLVEQTTCTPTSSQTVLTHTTPTESHLKKFRYSGDFRSPDMDTPQRARKYFRLSQLERAKKNIEIKNLKRCNMRLREKVESLEGMLNHLKEKFLITDSAYNHMMATMPESVKEILERKGRSKYSESIRKFALTLHFYSPRAYRYVRQTFNKRLPGTSTLCSWYQKAVEGKPGFTKEAFSALQAKTRDGKVICCNLVLDEIHIRRQVVSSTNGELHGLVDLGMNIVEEDDDDNRQLAGQALVFMVVGLKEKFKLPVGYFLVHSMTGEELASFVKICLHMLHEASIIVQSLTFDGAAVNFTMAKTLGAELDYTADFEPSFPHPTTKKPVYIFVDPSHSLKNIRNALAEFGPFVDGEGRTVSWQFIKDLVEVEKEEKRKLGTRIKQTHIDYKDNKMNVKLAAQTLSHSTYAALTVLKSRLLEFENCEGTANFCRSVNDVFDMLNTRHRLSSTKFSNALDKENRAQFEEEALKFEHYLANLKTTDGKPITETRRKKGFIGFICCLRNIFRLFDSLQEIANYVHDYLLVYKISQDHLENFFSAVRSCGGHNNNPNALQFRSAYKRLLVRHEVQASVNGNCEISDVPVLNVTSTPKERLPEPPVLEGVDVEDYDFIYECSYDMDDTDIEHDYKYEDDADVSDNISAYIGGFVVYKLISKMKCEHCKEALIETDPQNIAHPRNELIRLKTHRELQIPSIDVYGMCCIAEKLFILNVRHLYANDFSRTLCETVILATQHLFVQVLPCAGDEHRSKLMRDIALKYIRTRIFHELKASSEKKRRNIRRNFTKAIHFAHC